MSCLVLDFLLSFFFNAILSILIFSSRGSLVLGDTVGLEEVGVVLQLLLDL